MRTAFVRTVLIVGLGLTLVTGLGSRGNHTDPGDLALAAGSAPDFTEINAGLVGIQNSSVAWGDYDDDGDLDILLTGYYWDGSGHDVGKVYRNEGGGTFTDIFAPIAASSVGSVAWGDYDGDGDLDILLIGDAAASRITKLYRNDGGGSFAEVSAGLPAASYGSVAWGDYDNDGDLDILLTGSDASSTPIAQVYRSDGGSTFIDISAGLTGVDASSGAWGDYDNDGDLDILLTGQDRYSAKTAKVYRNDGGGAFTDIGAGLAAVSMGSAAWGDHDNDGDLDILLTGEDTSYAPTAKIYRNDGSDTFSDISAGLTGMYDGSAVWGDCDNDGDLDILLTGFSSDAGGTFDAKVYGNDGGGTFTDIGAGLTGVASAAAAWGDYDNDGDLDILLTGSTGWPDAVAKVYRNDQTTANIVPPAPTGLSANVNGYTAALSWSPPGSPGTTPIEALTYNLRVGTGPGKGDIVPPHALTVPGLANGHRLLPAMGNAQHGLTAFLEGLPDGTYYWSVQAIDHTFAGSHFSAEGQFTVPTFSLSLSKQATPIDGLRNNETLTYTLELSGPGLNVRLWDPLPPSVRYVAGSVTPPAMYSPTVRAVVWQGVLPTDTVQTIRFQVTPGITGTGSLYLAQPIVNTAWLTDTAHDIGVSASIIVNGWRVYLPLTQR
jgi:predicted nucleotidyltransferase